MARRARVLEGDSRHVAGPAAMVGRVQLVTAGVAGPGQGLLRLPSTDWGFLEQRDV